MKELRCSSPITLQKFVHTSCKVEFVSFFLSGFSFTNNHDSQDSRGRKRLSLYILSTTSTRFTDTQTLAGSLLQRAHLSVSSPGPDLVGEDLISMLFQYNNEPRPDTKVVGLSSKDIVHLSVQYLKQRRRTRKDLEFSSKMESIDPRSENL